MPVFHCCDEMPWSRATLGGRDSLAYTSRSQSITEQTQEETQTVVEAETMEECCLPAHTLSHLASFLT